MVSTLYFEDIVVGDIFTSSARTVTETDLTMFSMISGDWSAVHADAAYAEASRFVHGPFGIALGLGLFSRLSQFSGSAIALLDIRQWEFRAPILRRGFEVKRAGSFLPCFGDGLAGREPF